MKDRHGTSDSGLAASSGRSLAASMIESDLEEERRRSSQRRSSASSGTGTAAVSFRTRTGELQGASRTIATQTDDENMVIGSSHANNLLQQHEETATRRASADAHVAQQARERILEQEAAAKQNKKKEFMIEDDDDYVKKKKNSQKVSNASKGQESIPDVEMGSRSMISERSQSRRQSEGLDPPSGSFDSLVEPDDDTWKNEDESRSKREITEKGGDSVVPPATEGGGDAGNDEDDLNNEDDDSQQRPGAVAVRGRAFGQFPVWGRHRPNNNHQDTNNNGRGGRGLIGSIRNSISNIAVGSSSDGAANVPQAAEVHDATPIIYPESIATPNDLAREEQATKRRKRYCYAAVGFLVVGTLAVGIALGFGLGEAQNKDGGNESESDAVCHDIGDNPTLVLQCRCKDEMEQPPEDVVEMFHNLTVRLGIDNVTNDVNQGCESQNLALWWLAEDTVSEVALEEFETKFEEENNKTTANNATRNATSFCAMNQTQFLNQRYVLALMYLSMNGYQWERQGQWLSSNSTCHWEGVGCSFGTSRQIVFRLYLQHQGANGTIPAELGRLCGLRTLDLSRNELTGTVPSDLLMNLKYLRRILLKGNQLTGEIPDVISREGLDAVHDELESMKVPIPKILENTQFMELLDKLLDREGPLFEMDFSYNNFTGTFPAGLGLLTTLRVIKADRNHLKGLPAPPANITLFKDIEVISVSSNELHGSIPTHIGLLSRLEKLNLRDNMMTGTLVSEIGRLGELSFLYLSFNNFTGTIPDSYSRLERLIEFDVRNQDLKGPVPDNLCDSLTFLDPGVWVNCNSSLDEGCGCCLCGTWPKPSNMGRGEST